MLCIIYYKLLLWNIMVLLFKIGFFIMSFHINKIQVFQNKILQISTNVEWFIRNNEIHWKMNEQCRNTFLTLQRSSLLNCTKIRESTITTLTENSNLRDWIHDFHRMCYHQTRTLIHKFGQIMLSCKAIFVVNW